MVNSRLPCLPPQRVITAIMAFLAVGLAYMLRISLSYAITEMTVKPNRNATVSPDVCPPYGDAQNNTPSRTPRSVLTESIKRSSNGEELYDWDQSTQGLILSAFYWGYILTHVPGGQLAAKIGGKNTLLIGTMVACLFTMLTPLAIEYGGYNWLIVARVVVGLGEGVVFPACNTLLAAWTPLKERSISATVVYSGGMIGSVFGSSLSGILMSNYGWRSVFYIFGSAAVVWCFLFMFLCSNHPEDHPFISEREKNYLQRELGQLKRNKNLPPTPWRAMLTSPPMIALIFAQVGHNWGLFIIINDLPKYMSDVLRFPIKENGLYMSLAYSVMWIVGIFTGFVADFIIKNKYLSITSSRKLFTSIAAFGPAIFVVLASYAGCERVSVVILFVLGMGFMGTFYSGFKANSLDLAPNYAGTIMGIANGLGGLTGVVGPYIVGLLTENSLLSEWRIVFWITFAIFVGSTIVYVFFASGEIQPWNGQPIIEPTTKTMGATATPATYQNYTERSSDMK